MAVGRFDVTNVTSKHPFERFHAMDGHVELEFSQQ